MTFACLVLVLFTAESGLAQQHEQQPERRGFIGLGIGPSVPLGRFANASTTSMRSGGAATGYTDTILNLGYRIGLRLGVAGAFSYSEYPMRGGDGDDDWWQAAGLTVGPMYTRRLNARAALDLKAMIGLMVLTPIVDSYSTDDGVGSGLGVDLRAAIRYDVLRRWALFAEVGIQSSGERFDSGVRKDYRALISGIGVAFRPAW